MISIQMGRLTAAEIVRGRIFRKVTKMGRIWGDSMTEKAVWHVVKECAKRIGVAKLYLGCKQRIRSAVKRFGVPCRRQLSRCQYCEHY